MDYKKNYDSMHMTALPVVLKTRPAAASTGASDSQTILAATLSAMRNTDGKHKSKSPTVKEITAKLFFLINNLGQ